jgi:hypothetical protein
MTSPESTPDSIQDMRDLFNELEYKLGINGHTVTKDLTDIDSGTGILTVNTPQFFSFRGEFVYQGPVPHPEPQ